MSDQDLMVLVAQCDRGALEEIYKRYSERILKYVWNYLRRCGCGNEQDAEDITHDIFLSVKLSAPTYNPRRPFLPWLFAIAKNKCWDFCRERARHGAVPLGPNLIANIPTKKTGSVILPADIEECLKTLTPKEQLVFILAYIHNVKDIDIAEILGMTPVDVRVTKFRARIKMRLCLEKKGYSADDIDAEFD